MDGMNLPGVSLDPKDEAGLEQAFGVTSNAEELVKQNRARYTPEHKAALQKDVNFDLTQRVQALDEYDPEKSQYGLAAGPVEAELEEFLGHPVERAVVRGNGRVASISYVYLDDRGSYEKGHVPFAEVFGTDEAKQASRAARRPRDPDAAARKAADDKLREAESEAEDTLREAQEKIREELAEARAEAERILSDAQQEAAALREQAAEDAQAAAEDAREAAQKDDGGAKQRAARSGSSGGSEELTGEALDERARELDIPGRSGMTAEEKRAAIRKAEGS